MRTALVNIGQLVTCGSEGVEVVNDGALVFEEGRIVEVLADGQRPEANETLDVEGAVVLPGFIDAHTHLVFGGNRVDDLQRRSEGRTYQEIASLGGGIMDTVRKTRVLSEEDLYETGLKHLSWCLRNGTTTLEAKSGYGLDVQTELHILLALHRIDSTYRESIGEASGYRVFPTFLGLHALPQGSSREDYVTEMVDEVLTIVHNAGLATSVDAFVETGYFSPDDARRLAARAKELGMGVRLHVDQLSNGGGASLAAELAAMTADHLEQTDGAGIEALSRSKTIPVLLPASVFGLGLSKYPDARRMLDAGLKVVLATDFNPGSSPTPSLPFVMALAVRHMRMTPDECLAAVTVNAGLSLHLDDRGRLAPGQKADFSVWPLTDWREVMCWIDGPRPSQVWANGVRVT